MILQSLYIDLHKLQKKKKLILYKIKNSDKIVMCYVLLMKSLPAKYVGKQKITFYIARLVEFCISMVIKNRKVAR